jgi:serine/threonine protein kinase
VHIPNECNSAALNASGGKDKVTVDDFDLLTLIGKGSFGKVMQVCSEPFICYWLILSV